MTTFGVTMREVPEWVATHPDQAIPRAVKARVLHRYGGKCYLTGKKLAAGEIDYDHIKALANGGEHRESNLAPIWRKKHVEKTADDRAEQAKTQRMHDKHFGIIRPAGRLKGRGFQQSRRHNTRNASSPQNQEPNP